MKADTHTDLHSGETGNGIPCRRQLSIAFAIMAVIPLLTCGYFLSTYVLPYTVTSENIFIVSFVNVVLALCGYFLLADAVRQQIRSLAETAKQWEVTFDTVKEVVWLLDANMRIVRANRATETSLGLKRQALTGRHCCEVLHGIPAPVPDCPTARAARSLKGERSAIRIGDRWYEITADPIIDEGGRYAGAVHMMTDITEERRIQETLNFQKVLLEAQNEASIEGNLIVDEKGKMLWHNRRFIDIWNLPGDALESRSDDEALRVVLDKLVDPDAFLAKVQYLYVNHDQESLDEARLKDGRVFERYSAPVTDKKGVYLGRVWSFRDVTEHRRAESRIEEQLAELRRWHESMLDREDRILELKREVNQLSARVGERSRYSEMGERQA